MKIGIFDSGLGGLLVLKSVRKALPAYDYVYLGDTKRVPYGSKTQATIHKWSKAAVDYLFRTENCQLILIACNTISVQALRKLQREYLPHAFPGRRILGVVVPTLETVLPNRPKRIGLIGTAATIKSNVYKKELKKLGSDAKLYAKATPRLVPLLENHELAHAKQALRKYLASFKQKQLDTLVLGCTHYCVLKQEAKNILGSHVRVITQDQIIPKRLAHYLRKHPELRTKLSTHRTLTLLYTKYNKYYALPQNQVSLFDGQVFRIVHLPPLTGGRA